MRNAKHIGLDIANSCGLGLGKPTYINENSYQITTSSYASSNEIKTLNELIEEKSIAVNITLNVVFELRLKKKFKE
jgi:hypothetical protein